MTTHDEKLLKVIPVPTTINEKQTELAIKYARSKMLEGFTIGTFCSDNKISTKTWYSYLENPDFVTYLAEVQNVVIPTTEKNAYEKFKQHVLRIPYKENPSIKELEFYADTFSYLAENDKRQKINAMDSENIKASKFASVDERKASLLSRLKG